jgi:hypothetical protein
VLIDEAASEAKTLKLAYSIPVEEGETLSDFIQKSSDPKYVRSVKEKLKRVIEPNRLAIATILGKYYSIEYDENDTLEKMKEKIQNSQGIPPEQVRLYYNGELLENPLSKFSLKPGQIEDVVYLRLSLR